MCLRRCCLVFCDVFTTQRASRLSRPYFPPPALCPSFFPLFFRRWRLFFRLLRHRRYAYQFHQLSPLPTTTTPSMVWLLFKSLDDGAWLSTRHQVYFSNYSFFSPPLFFPFFSLPRTFDLGVVWTCLAPFHGLLLKVASSQTETCTSHFSQIFYLYISSSLRCFRYWLWGKALELIVDSSAGRTRRVFVVRSSDLTRFCWSS